MSLDAKTLNYCADELDVAISQIDIMSDYLFQNNHNLFQLYELSKKWREIAYKSERNLK